MLWKILKNMQYWISCNNNKIWTNQINAREGGDLSMPLPYLFHSNSPDKTFPLVFYFVIVPLKFHHLHASNKLIISEVNQMDLSKVSITHLNCPAASYCRNMLWLYSNSYNEYESLIPCLKQNLTFINIYIYSKKYIQLYMYSTVILA